MNEKTISPAQLHSLHGSTRRIQQDGMKAMRMSHRSTFQGRQANARYLGTLAGMALIIVGLACILQRMNIHFLSQSILILIDLVFAFFWSALIILLGLVFLAWGLGRLNTGAKPETEFAIAESGGQK